MLDSLIDKKKIDSIIYDTNYLKFVKNRESSPGSSAQNLITSSMKTIEGRDVSYECVKSELRCHYNRRVM